MAKVPRSPSLERLKDLAPEVKTLQQSRLVWRVYSRGGHHPISWKSFRHVGPVDARFDHHQGDEPHAQDRAIMYLADDPVTCLAEVFQKTRVINRWHNDPWLVGFELDATLDVLDLSVAFATRAGASTGLMTGPRSVSRNWARGFYEAYPALSGLYYPSSMHANQTVIALTDRAKEKGMMPAHPSFHRALNDPALLSVLRNSARSLGYALN